MAFNNMISRSAANPPAMAPDDVSALLPSYAPPKKKGAKMPPKKKKGESLNAGQRIAPRR